MSRDNNNEAAKALTNMFAGAAIEYYSFNGGTIDITLTDGDTIAIRHEIKGIGITSCGYGREERKYVSGGILPRVQESIKTGQVITAAWVEKHKTRQPPAPYDEYDETPGETTEAIELWVMYNGDLRPTRLSINKTKYTRKPEHPDFTITRGEATINADSAHIEPECERPRPQQTRIELA